MSLRVLHAPCLAAGNPGRLARAERELGLASWCASSDPNPYGYAVDEQLRTIGEGRLGFELQRWKLLARALREFDVVHFNFGRTLFPNAWPLDLPLLKRAGKAIFMTFQGDDARQGDYSRSHFPITFATRVDENYYAGDEEKRQRIRNLDRYADGIFALNPDLLHVLPARAKFLPYANVDLDAWQPAMPQNAVPVVVHAPTHRAVKGSDLIIAAAKRLEAEGARFELVLVENMSHAEARRAYERADLAIDQLFAGWYGGFAVEMMALGKPVLSYLRESDFRFLPEGMAADLPVIPVKPDEVFEKLKTWIGAPRERLQEIGRLGRAYVEKWHAPRRVAERLKTEYEAALARRAR
jgi:glycosyltransferase involved in cell wall biosynthesis